MYEQLNGSFIVSPSGLEWKLSKVSERLSFSGDRVYRCVDCVATLYSGRSHRLGERCSMTLRPDMKFEKVSKRGKQVKTESIDISIPMPGWYYLPVTA